MGSTVRRAAGIAMAAAFWTLASGCVSVGSGRAPGGDRDLEAAIRQRLDMDAVATRQRVAVAVQYGRVILDGRVEGPGARLRVRQIVEATPGVLTVTDRMVDH